MMENTYEVIIRNLMVVLAVVVSLSIFDVIIKGLTIEFRHTNNTL